MSKQFGPTRALSNVTFALRSGEVVALVGENGAGKSTCVKVLGGVYRPDSGSVKVDGHAVEMRGPVDSQRLGIAVVNQHPSLFGDMSIAENVFAGRPLRGASGFIDHARMRQESRHLLDRLGLDRSARALARTLRTSEQQMVEIARALAAEAKVLILDEPTAALSTVEVDALFQVIDELRNEGVSILFVGHRLEEIFRISDQLVILRDGQLVDTRRTSETTPAEAVKLMVGRTLSDLYPHRESTAGEVVLETIDLSTASGLQDINVTIRAGEIVGLAGLVGSGRTELARVLFGIDAKTSGQISLDGRVTSIRSPSAAMARGIAYVSEDRHGQSLVEDFSILDNATLPVIQRATKFGLVLKRLQIGLVSSSLHRMNLKFANFNQPIGNLSGGNQQKVVLAKWLATNPRLLILDEPTQGIDVGAKAEVHRVIADLAAQGLAILLISSDMPEVLGMADRIMVMRRGRIAAEFDKSTATQESVAAAATGTVTELIQASPSDPIANRSPASGPPDSVTADTTTTSPLGFLSGRRELGLVGVLVLMVLPIVIINPRFLSSANLLSLSAEAALVGIVAVGELLVVLTRNIDVSVGSTIGLSAFVFGEFVRDHPHTVIVVPLLVSLALGVVCGALNGLTIGYGGVPSIVVTLGTLYIYRGIDSIISTGQEIAPGDIPQSMQNLISQRILGIPNLLWATALIFILAGSFLRWTNRGRQLYEVGCNPEGARLIGVPINRRILFAYTVSGTLASLDGALWALHYGIVDGQSAYGLELTVIAAVVVGGVALRGGYGTALGVALGTVVLFTIQNIFELARVNSDDLEALYGAAIIIAVGVDMVLTRRVNAKTKVI